MIEQDQIRDCFLASMPMAAYAKDLDGHFVFGNHRWLSTTKQRSEEQSTLDLCHDEEECLVLQTGQPVVEVTAVSGSATPDCVHFTFPLRNAQGVIVGVGGLVYNDVAAAVSPSSQIKRHIGSAAAAENGVANAQIKGEAPTVATEAASGLASVSMETRRALSPVGDPEPLKFGNEALALDEYHNIIDPLMETSLENVVILDRKGMIVECSDVFAYSLLSTHNSRFEVIGKNLWTVMDLSPNALSVVVRELSRRRNDIFQVFDTGRPFHSEHCLDVTGANSDEEESATACMDCRIAPVSWKRTRGSGPLAVDSVVVRTADVSQKGLVAQTHDRIENLSDHLQCAFALHQLLSNEQGEPTDYVFLKVNRAFEEMTGLLEKNVIGRRVTDVIPGIENDGPNWIRRYGRVVTSGKADSIDHFAEDLRRWYNGVAYPLPGEQFVTLFYDVSRYVGAEEALRESEERHRILFNSMLQGAIYHDTNGNVIAANPSAAQILGLSQEQVTEKASLPEGWKIVREDGTVLPSEEHPFRIALATGKPISNAILGVVHPHRGDISWISVNAIPNFRLGNPCDNPRPFQVYTTLTNVTTMKQAAEAASKLKSAFLASVSHEIRTPLNAIMGYIDLALSNDLSDENRQENIEGLVVARQSGRLLLAVVSNILDQAMIAAGAMAIDCSLFDLSHVVDQVCALGRSLVENQKDIEISSEISDDVAKFIHGDQFRLQQILEHLISNAAKFTEKGVIKIVTRLIHGHQMLEICVRDSGQGIPQSHLESIFEPFCQVDYTDTRSHGGTGLGLAICKSVVQLMGGSIRIESSVNQGSHGSAFYVSLPYKPGTKQVVSQHKFVPEIPSNTKAQLGSTNVGRILLVEDDLVSRRLAKRLLENAGYEVAMAVDGVEAVEAFKSDRSFNLILMDLMMPRMDGIEAARTIRAIEASEQGNSKRIPIVALSAGAMKGDRESMLAVGMTAFLSKPVNYKLLQETLVKYIG